MPWLSHHLSPPVQPSKNSKKHVDYSNDKKNAHWCSMMFHAALCSKGETILYRCSQASKFKHVWASGLSWIQTVVPIPPHHRLELVRRSRASKVSVSSSNSVPPQRRCRWRCHCRCAPWRPGVPRVLAPEPIVTSWNCSEPEEAASGGDGGWK